MTRPSLTLAALSDSHPPRATDPGVFTGILHELGVRGVQVEELWGLDSDLLKDLESVPLLERKRSED